MSFRVRLTLFFVLIVVLPIVALAVLVSQVASDSESGKVDARLSAGLRTATTVYEGAQDDSRRGARRIAADLAADPAAIDAFANGDTDTLRSLARDQIGGSVAVVQLTDSGGAQVIAGKGKPAASSSVDLTDGSRAVGSVTASSITSSELLDQIETATGEDAALIGPGGPITATVPIETGALPDGGETATLDSEGGELRVAATEPLGDDQVRVALFASSGGEGFLSSQPKIAIALAVFLLLAVGAVALLLRALQGQIKEMLRAARRIGVGRLLGPGAGQRQRRDGRARERVQQDERAALRADGPAAPPAGRDREVRAADRRGVRLRPRPPGAARDPGRDSRRHLRGRLRPGRAQRPCRRRGGVRDGDRRGPGGGAERRAAGAAPGRPGRGLTGRRPRVRELARADRTRPRRRSGR